MKEIDKTALPQDVIEYINSLENENAVLSDNLEKLKKAMFGQSSEKTKYIDENSEDQLSLFNEAECEASAKAVEPTVNTVKEHIRKQKRTREEITKDLPREVTEYDLTDSEKEELKRYGELTRIGSEHVRTEIQIIPAQVKVLEIKRAVYAVPSYDKTKPGSEVIKATVPDAFMRKSMASPSSAAYTMYQKYVNSVPLYRQEKDWRNQGVELSRATLANWIIHGSQVYLKPLCNELKKTLLKQPVIHADETVVQVLDEKGRKASAQSRMWVYCTGGTDMESIALYEYTQTRAGENARAYLGEYKGYLQTDGYSGYKQLTGTTHCGCWAHARRKWDEALPKGDTPENSESKKGLEYCNRLFELEKQYEKDKLTPGERKEARIKSSKPVLDEYFAWLKTIRALSGSNLYKAAEYSKNQEAELRAFLLDGRIEISNNRAENAVRPFVIGRKNWLFSKTPKGAQASATAYSVIETAKANGLNPFAYLTYLFTMLPAAVKSGKCLAPFLPWSTSIPDYCKL